MKMKENGMFSWEYGNWMRADRMKMPATKVEGSSSSISVHLHMAQIIQRIT